MTVIYHDPRFLEHETGEHPECPERLRHLIPYLERQGLLERCQRGSFSAATRGQLAAVHTGPHLDRVSLLSAVGGGRVESDTVMSARSAEVAALAAGAAVAAVDQVLTRTDRQAVCLIRPPGHHALADQIMGFCLFNNVAVAAEHAQRAHGLERVLIVDWDVHHGNGTQDIFYESDRVHFFSAHRSPFYPGTGDEEETGTGAGLGATWNLPLAYGIERRRYRERFLSMLESAAARCRPELILISAGFDAHAADPIGSLDLETEDFGTLTGLVQQVAASYCGGRLVSLLEGGYNIEALAESVGCHLETLLVRESDPH